MVRLHRLTYAVFATVCLGALVCAGGCRRTAPRAGDQVVSRERIAASARVVENPARLFGEDGELLKSNMTLFGLPLPRGLTERYVAGRQHSYESGVQAEKLHAYFGPLLVTGNVERVGEGVIYRNATVRQSSGSARVDVAIFPLANHRTSVSITELYVPPSRPPNESLIEEALRRQNAQAR